MPYLLAAEADKIQEFIFRSSSLREVVGASQLLAEFCDDVTSFVGGTARPVVSAGGSFRLVFDDEVTARRYGADIAERYRLLVDGRLSVAEPVPMSGSFQDANQHADVALRRVKSHRQAASAEAHMPYIAFCASCGVGLADCYDRLPKEPAGRGPRYLCLACRTKAEARWTQRRPFLRRFLERVIGDKRNVDQFDWPDDADAVARYDPSGRSYVAYLVADGNGMGALFGQCDEAQIGKLSVGLTEAIETSLAVPTGSLMRHLHQQVNVRGQTAVPVLPLILGGDDLFALIPAAYALDVARCFCLRYEQEVGELVQSLGLESRPTVAAAVVICKSSYPYALAHRRAEALLKLAKRQSKLLAAETDEQLSTVHFEVILGNSLAGLAEQNVQQQRIAQPSLRPYWVARSPDTEQPMPALSEEALRYGVALDTLLDQRWLMKDVPRTRLAELRRRFEDLPRPSNYNERHDQFNTWARTLTPVLKRSGYEKQLGDALAALGQPPLPDEPNGAQPITHYWRELERDGATPLAHGMPDLLEVWEFAQDLSHSLDEYAPEEAD